MPSFTLTVPEDFELARDLCSYGYFLLAPNRWVPGERVFQRPFELGERAVRVRLTQPRGGGTVLRVETETATRASERATLERQVRRMLRLEMAASEVRGFHKVDPRWKKSGRGRLFRSPTLFEDIIKTVTSCNVTWPGTVGMNLRLCEVLGADGGFPGADRIAPRRPAFLRTRCRVGYRDARLVELARLYRKGAIDVAAMEDPSTPDEVVREALLELPGIGPYAAANIMQLLGRYGHLPLDTESVRHGRAVLGYRGTSAQVMKRVREHFAPFGRYAFLSYWFELWAFYEGKHGPSHLWERDATGKLFTAALLAGAAKGSKSRGGRAGALRRPREAGGG